MPNIKSAAKRMRQNKKRRLRNRGVRGRMRNQIRSFSQLLKEEKTKEAQNMLQDLYSVIDKSVSKGVVHANTAARYKSRLTKHLHSLSS